VFTNEKRVEYYRTADDRVPFQEWYFNLKDKRTQARILMRLHSVQLGNFGYCNAVGQGVMELKIDHGPGYRVYFGQMGTAIVILLCGGDKSTQQKDIANAHNYWKDYRRQYAQETT
jgi:putative addiction module killer protein